MKAVFERGKKERKLRELHEFETYPSSSSASIINNKMFRITWNIDQKHKAKVKVNSHLTEIISGDSAALCLFMSEEDVDAGAHSEGVH